jgi:hypothetical protein
MRKTLFMDHPHSLNLSRPEELAYWSRLLKVTPLHLVRAAKATGSNLIDRLVYYLKSEDILPFHFDLGKVAL